jgi:diamine N-acetyltransferase
LPKVPFSRRLRIPFQAAADASLASRGRARSAPVTAPDFPAGLSNEGDLELRRIYLFSKFHGSGASRRMMDLAIASARQQNAKRLLLGVHPDNQRALAFYRKVGFIQIAVRTFHVGDCTFQDPVLALTLNAD